MGVTRTFSYSLVRDNVLLKIISEFFSQIIWHTYLQAGVSEWSKEAGLGPAAVGLRGFEPHPPHQNRTQ